MTEEEAPVGSTSTTVGWLELFFDLVVVAAVAVLTHGLQEDPSIEGLGLFAMLFTAIWFSWVSVVLYANVAGDSTRTRTIVVGMFLVAVMAASSPLHFEERANAFAGAFLVLRVVTGQGSLHTGRVLTTWPLLQFGGATLPWLVSLWVDTPWKYALWGAGLLLDLVVVIAVNRPVDDRRLTHLQERLDRVQESRGKPGDPPLEVTVVGVDREHLAERLGLFLIIVLGEVVSQLVLKASTTEWTGPFVRVVVGCFLVLVTLWSLAFTYGATGTVTSRIAEREPRIGLPMHLVSTLGVVAMAAGFGELLIHPEEHAAAPVRWIMCGGLALHIAVVALSGAPGSATRRWVVAWAVPCTLGPLVIAGAGAELRPALLVWLLLACAAWLAAYPSVTRLNGMRKT